MDTFLLDVRYAVRTLAKHPAFTAVAVLTLALGIGASTAVFSAVDAALLRPLPHPDADRIVTLAEAESKSPREGRSTSSFNFEDWRASSRSFESMGLLHGWNPTLTGTAAAVRVKAALVTHGVFDVLRAVPSQGRPIQEQDGRMGSENVAVLTDGFWRSRLGGDAHVLGRKLTLNGRGFTVIGVLPPGFTAPGELDAELWANESPDARDTRGSRYLRAIARLSPGVTLHQAREEMRAISMRLAIAYPKENGGMEASVTPLREALTGDTHAPLLFLLGASGLLLLIASANLSNLLLSRGLGRGRELAVRAALGASRGRVIRQLLTESAVLSAAGAGLGIALASLGLGTLRALGPEALTARGVAIDGRVLVFATLVSLATAALFGLLPALRLTRIDLRTGLQESSGGATRGNHFLRDLLAGAQLALALTLLATAGLLVRSFGELQRVEPGIRPERLLTAAVNLPAARYADGTEPATYDRLVERVAALPGVRSVAVSSIVPFSGSWDRVAVEVEGRAAVAGADRPEADRYIVSPGYAATAGLTIVAGRFLSPDDRAGAPPAVVVDEVFGRKLAPGASPIGLRITAPGRKELATIVGVVGHVKHYGLDGDSGGQLYLAQAQYPWRFMRLVVESASTKPGALTTAVRDAVQEVDPDLAPYSIATMGELMARRTVTRRLAMALLGVFAGIAVVLAVVGLYGVVSYLVSQRRREIAIRIALGANPRDVVGLFVRHGARLAVAGAALGLLGSELVAGFVRGLLFRVSPTDPLVLGGVAALLVATSVVASALPARRASRLDPNAALRAD